MRGTKECVEENTSLHWDVNSAQEGSLYAMSIHVPNTVNVTTHLPPAQQDLMTRMKEPGSLHCLEQCL